MSKNIIITPHRNDPSYNPRIDFYGDTSGAIRLEVLEDGALSFMGNKGTLFGIVDDASGSLMSVNNISGLPIFEVWSDDEVDVNGVLNVESSTYIGGFLGVNTSVGSPGYLATIGGNTEIKGSLYLNATSPIFYFGSYRAMEKSGSDLVIGGLSTTTGYSKIKFTTFEGTSKERLTIDGSGRIGINEPNPLFTLDVSGNVNIDGSVNIDVSIANGQSYLTIKQTGNTYPIMQLRRWAAYYPEFYSANSQYFTTASGSSTVFKNTGSGVGFSLEGWPGLTNTFNSYQGALNIKTSNGIYDIYFSPNSSDAMRISASTGFVGIKTPTPKAALDVSGNVNVDGSLNLNNQSIINVATPINASDAVNKYYVDTKIKSGTTYLDPSLWDTSTYTYTLNTVSNVSINSTDNILLSPISKLDSTYWANAGVFCTDQSLNILYFTCDTIPNASINIKIVKL